MRPISHGGFLAWQLACLRQDVDAFGNIENRNILSRLSKQKAEKLVNITKKDIRDGWS